MPPLPGTAGPVRLQIFDLAGLLVATLLDEAGPADCHEVTWNGRDSQGRALPSGPYIVRLETEDRVEARKVMLVRCRPSGRIGSECGGGRGRFGRSRRCFALIGRLGRGRQVL